MPNYWRYLGALAVVLILVQLIGSRKCHPNCSCNPLSDGSFIVDCNGESIRDVMDALRDIDLVGNVSQLTFLGAPETALEMDVFQGLIELRVLTIQFCMSLTEIRPGAFNSLAKITALQLENNALEWLSGESFQGIGPELLDLYLSDNMLRNLRSDLQPFFESISDSISLSGNSDFVCDCHLQWLADFVATHPVNPTVVLNHAYCADPPNTLFTNSVVDFSMLQCLDFCALGYHSCHEQATCTQVVSSTHCSCNQGYSGDGIVCNEEPVDLCANISCNDNSNCSISPVPRCICNQGYTGNGQSCILIGECEEMCSSGNDSDVHCNLNIIDGRVDCGSESVQELQNNLLLLAANPSLDPGLVMFSSQLSMVAANISFPGDVPAIVDLLTESVNIFRGMSQYNNATFHNLVNVGSELLHFKNQPLWSDIDETSVSDHVTDLFVSIERLGEALFLGNGTTNDQIVTSENIALIVAKPDCEAEEQDNITVSSALLETPTGGDSSLQLPPSVFGTEYNCSEVGIIAVVYNGVGPLLNLDNELIPNCTSTPAPLVYGQCKWSDAVSFCPDLQVNSVIISAVAVRSDQNQSIDQLNTTSLLDPIIITLYHENVSLTDPRCAFLDDEQTQLDDGTWQTNGCQLVAYTTNTTICECYHLTSFALLMSPTGPTQPTAALQIVSKIGLCISIICLILTIILLFGLKLDTKRLHHIHRQLALALCLAQLLFLVAVDRTLVPSPDVLCTIIAGLLHYLFLCTFAWQLVEGVHLYLFIVKVFFNERIVWAYYPLAWGVPLIVVGITMGIRYCDYGSESFCWITNGNGANWAFHGPVLAVLAVNIIIMIVVTAVIVRARRKRSQDTFLICTLLHASLVLVPILGITWLLGFFVVGDTTFAEVIEWLFCIFTTLQGVMIFIMHCVLNRDVRKAFLKKMGCHEAAKNQERLTIRRSSTVQSFNQMNVALKRSFNFTKTRRASVSDITSFQMSDSFDSTRSFKVARPHSAKARIHAINPLVDIQEEGDSLPNSLVGTPSLSPINPKASNGKRVVLADDVDYIVIDQVSADNSPIMTHTRTDNGSDLH